MRRLIMFDLDGTLVRTSSEDALFVQAMKTWLNINTVNSDWTSYEHVTDAGIATELFLRFRQRPPLQKELETACDLLFQQWTSKLIHDPSACIPMDGATQLFQKLLKEINLSLAIATGGWGKTAYLKLTNAQMPFQGLAMASSTDALSREHIMQLAYSRAAAKAGVLGFDGVAYIGDGSWDLAAARNLGYGFIGIGTGKHREALLSKGAEQVISDFCDLEAVIQLMVQEAEKRNH